MKKVLCWVALLLTGLSFIAAGESREDVQQVISTLNLMRRVHDLGDLTIDPLITIVAEDYAAYCISRNAISHQDEHGRRVLHRIRQTGDTALRAGEVIGSGPDVQEIVHRWMNSADHYRVITDPLWTHVGVGMEQHRKGVVIVVVFKTRLFDTARTELLEDGISVSLYSFDDYDYEPVIVYGGVPYEAYSVSEDRRSLRFRLPGRRKIYYLLFGIRLDNRIVYTDRIITERE